MIFPRWHEKHILQGDALLLLMSCTILQKITNPVSFLHVMNFFQKSFRIPVRNTVFARSNARLTKYPRNLTISKLLARILQEKKQFLIAKESYKFHSFYMLLQESCKI